MFQDGVIGSISTSKLDAAAGPRGEHAPGQFPRHRAATTCARTQCAGPESQRKMAERQHCLRSLPSQRFQALFNSLFKVLCIFPSRYLFAIGLPPVFSFRWSLPPVRAALPSNSTRRVRSIRRKAPSTDGTVTLYRVLFQGTSPGAAPGHPAVDYNSAGRNNPPIYNMSFGRFSRPY